MKTLKQKALFAAVAGATALVAGTAGAVNVNENGLGQVLIYPYFTVRNGQVTLVSVVNTATAPKVVKVRFLEGKNTAEVLDFNLFLSAGDVWTGAVVETADKAGGGLVWSDKSCTTPANPGGIIPFSNLAYATAYDGVGIDGPLLRGLDRTKEGYLEIIEMAEINPASPLGSDVTHKAGVPTCALTASDSVTGLSTFASATTITDSNGNISVVSTVGSYLRFPTGGLFGNGTVLNANGSSTGYNATALDNFWATTTTSATQAAYTPQIVASGNNYPNIAGNVTGSASSTNLVSYSSVNSLVVANNTAHFASWNFGIQAVSASLMRNQIMGEYAFTTDGVIGTDWVITMPTKRYHVNVSSTNFVYSVPVLPFAKVWNGTFQSSLDDYGPGTSCDVISFTGRDREEGKAVGGGAVFSPAPAGGSSSICYEANVISYGATSSDTKSKVVSSVNFAGLGVSAAIQNGGVSPVPVGKEGGWGTLTFTNGQLPTTGIAGYATSASQLSLATPLVAGTPVTPSAGAGTYYGLPVVGFVFSGAAYNAGNPAQNYSNSYALVYGRKIQ